MNYEPRMIIPSTMRHNLEAIFFVAFSNKFLIEVIMKRIVEIVIHKTISNTSLLFCLKI